MGKTRSAEGIEASSGNVFADLGLPDALTARADAQMKTGRAAAEGVAGVRSAAEVVVVPGFGSKSRRERRLYIRLYKT